MTVQVQRIYDERRDDGSARVLVDRLWPRGVSKERAGVDHWLKEVAPSHELRRWFDHDAAKWDEFKGRYFAELDANPEAVEALLTLTQAGDVTLLFGAKESEYNNAMALQEYLSQKPGD